MKKNIRIQNLGYSSVENAHIPAIQNISIDAIAKPKYS
jgi:hypothetical protein